MQSRTVKPLAWSLFAVFLGLSVAIPLVFSWLWLRPEASIGSVFGDFWLFSAVALPLALVGLLIAVKRPENPIGWLMLGIAIAQQMSSLSDTLDHHWTSFDGIPLGQWLAWVSRLFASPSLMMLIAVLPLLFPTGRLASRRWRLVFGLAMAATVVWTFDGAFGHETLDSPAMPDAVKFQPLADAVRTFKPIEVLLITSAVLTCLASLVIRFRRAEGMERQQFKVLTFTMSLVIATFITSGVMAAIDPVNQMGLIGTVFWISALFGVIIGLPVAIGIAILRHSLYGIDVVINRALVYGTLTLLLGATYAVGVVLSQQMLAGLASGSDLAVAGTTLLVAGLVRPARSRVQRTVDRRFYRHKYDAARTIDAFSSRLRDELDLDTLVSEIRVVVNDTMHPRHVSVWLRPKQ